ncbi:MAG: 8-oxo-dGTP diphosphatase MutT [Clostridia bacterium]|nr:8-oxo-dGTP diphosphatase MutT [Clostridia bacterium]
MTPVAVTAGLIRKDGCILISRRHTGGGAGGKWEFPGGKIERGETPEQALKRELAEELGVQVSVGRIYDARIHEYPEKTVLVLFYECTLVNGEARALDSAEIKWVLPNDLNRYDMAAADLPVALKIITEKEKTDAQ